MLQLSLSTSELQFCRCSQNWWSSMTFTVNIRLSRGSDLLVDASNSTKELTTSELKNLFHPLIRNLSGEDFFRLKPSDLYFFQKRLSKHGYQYKVHFDIGIPLEHTVSHNFSARDYQKKAIEQWSDNQHRGCIILPTGAGKTVLGILAIASLNVSTLIIVPTLALLEQWRESLLKNTSLTSSEIGHLSSADSDRKLAQVTLITYQGLRNLASSLGSKFGLLIIDECHHSSGKLNAQSLSLLTTLNRLGLTATFPDNKREKMLLQSLIGPAIQPQTLAGLVKEGHLSTYEINTVYTPFSPHELEDYNKERKRFQEYYKQLSAKYKTHDFMKLLVFRSSQDPEAREALKSHRISRRLVFSCSNKFEAIEELLIKHKFNKVIIFSESNHTVYEISKRFFIPFITHEITGSERRSILEFYKTHSHTKLVSGRVLDEGFDCGDVDIGIMVSGTSSTRQYVQRLGRLLRPSVGKEKATLYELVTPMSFEVRHSQKRKRSLSSK